MARWGCEKVCLTTLSRLTLTVAWLPPPQTEIRPMRCSRIAFARLALLPGMEI
jgi:hypothetical protein